MIDKATDFTSSPLITPQRLEQDLADAMRTIPSWARWFTLADALDGPGPSMCVMRLGDTHPGEFFIPTVSAAILFELTRYGGSVATNTNKKAGDPDARFYLKMTFTGATRDNMPVSRIIKAASPREEVVSSTDSRDLHPDALGTRGSGKPTKDARAIALGHAKLSAEGHLGGDAEAVAAYLANLDALFVYHDDLFGIGQAAY